MFEETSLDWAPTAEERWEGTELAELGLHVDMATWPTY